MKVYVLLLTVVSLHVLSLPSVGEAQNLSSDEVLANMKNRRRDPAGHELCPEGQPDRPGRYRDCLGSRCSGRSRRQSGARRIHPARRFG